MYHENPYHREFTKFFIAPDVIIESIKAMPFVGPNHVEDLMKKNLHAVVEHHQSSYKKTHDMHHHKMRECHRKMHDLLRSLHQDQRKLSIEQIIEENKKHLQELTEYSTEMYRELAEHMLHNTKTAITRIGDNFMEFMNQSIQNANTRDVRSGSHCSEKAAQDDEAMKEQSCMRVKTKNKPPRVKTKSSKKKPHMVLASDQHDAQTSS